VAKKKKSFIGLIVIAALIGAAIGVAVFNYADEPIPTPAIVDLGDEYDDSWGRLDRPQSPATVTHILISWQGKSGRVVPKDPRRTEQQARELVVDLWNRYKADPTTENWRKLQAEYNEDSAPHNEYTCELPNPGLDEDFNNIGLTTRVNHARVAWDSAFGFHLIRRER
jgi:hypothetical protein